MICVESAAHVEQLRNSQANSSPYLDVYSFEYQVKVWDGLTLSAVRVNPHGDPVDEVLTIDFKRRVVRKTWKARAGNDGYFEPAEQTSEMMIDQAYETPAAR